MSFFMQGTRPLWLALLAGFAVYAIVAADAYGLRLLTMAGVFALLGIGYQLVFGHVGALSLAQGAFYGCGAYAAALAAKSLGLPLPVTLLLAALVPAVLAAVIAIPVLRLETHYFALATLGIAQVVHLLAVNWESLTGGANGLGSLPPPSLAGVALEPGGLGWLALVWTLVGIAAFVVARIVDGLAGRSLVLVREHPLAARSLGIDTARWRFVALVAGAAMAGTAGALAAFTAGVVSPDVTDLAIMVSCLTLVVVGGRRHVAGAVLGAILIVHLPEWFRFLDRFWLVAYGIATLAILIAAPEGIVGTIDAWWRRRHGDATSQGEQLGTDRSPTRPVPAAATLLQARGLHKSFGGVRALDDVSLTVRGGEIVGLIGPNGSGKTTLVNLLTGIERADRGTIELGGRPIIGLAPHRIASLGIARSFQNLELPALLSPMDNVAVALTQQRIEMRPLAAFWDSVSARRLDPALGHARSIAHAQLRHVGFHSLPEVSSAGLPAGRRRLVEVARALAAAPAILLLDEPAAGLSEPERQQLAAVLRRAAGTGVAVLVIEHALGFLLPLADRVVCLDRGRIVAEGTPQALRSDPRLAQAYFGVVPALADVAP